MSKRVRVQTGESNFGGTIHIKGGRIYCYTKKQLKAFHPDGYDLLGELPAQNAADAVNTDVAEISEPKTYNRFIYAVKGYWRCGERSYAAIVKNALPQRILLMLLVCACIVSAALSAPFLQSAFESRPAGGGTSSVTEPELDPDADAYNGEKPADKGDPNAANTQVPGYKTVSVNSATGELSIAPHNPEGNPCYFVVSLVSGGKELYKSKMLAPGQAVYNAKLSEIPAKGTYQATVKYECFHLETMSPLNGAEINVELIIK